MLASLKSEFRKMLTVRSTYVVFIISLLLVVLFAGFGDGFRGSQAGLLHNPSLLEQEAFSAIVFGGIILALAGLLIFGHEYRYNGILYTLTSSNSRLKSLLAKALVISVYAVVVSVVVMFFSPFCTIVGAHLAGKSIGSQTFHTWDVLWRGVFCGWAYAMYAFAAVAILRSQVGSIVTFLVIPLIGEGIVGHVFPSSVQYLPFHNVQALVDNGVDAHLGHNITVVLAYIGGTAIVSAVLFARRDAN